MDGHNDLSFSSQDGIVYLNGLFFLTHDLIQSKDPLLGETIEKLYKHVNVN